MTVSPLNWGINGAGDDLLDLTDDPLNPTIVTAGVYSVTALVHAHDDMTPGTQIEATLHMDAENEDATVTLTSAPATADFPQPRIALFSIFYLPVGAVVRVTFVANDAGRGYVLEEGTIQRIT